VHLQEFSKLRTLHLKQTTTNTTGSSPPEPELSAPVGLIIGIIIAAVVVVVIVLALIIWLICKRTLKNQTKSQSNFNSEEISVESSASPNSKLSPSKYKFLKDIQKVAFISGGQFGQVYKGKWHGTEVALKQIRDASTHDALLKEASVLE
jgi:hypothetical protein